MYERVDQCPICANASFKNAIICEDHSVSGESFALVDCTNCQLRFTNPRPGIDKIEKYYQSEHYISHTAKASNFINLLYKLAQKYTLKHKINIIKKLCPSPSPLLDFGCGTGDFLKACKEKQWDTAGVEPNKVARELAKKTLDIYPSIDLIPKKEYKVITLWHVLEHVHNINETLEALINRLHKKGLMLIAVPNHKCYDAQKYQEFWAAYDVPRHLYHFNQHAMEYFLKKNKLKVIQKIPQKLDAYYVSLLSEKYIAGKKGVGLSLLKLINAFIIGWKSNSWASKNNLEFSSLIYVVTK